MESKNNMIPVITRIHFRFYAFSLRLFALALICLGTLDALSQSQPSRKLTLISPDDAGFDTLLDHNFPGFQKLDEYQALRRYLVLLRNDTNRSARAYSVEWKITSNSGMVTHLYHFRIQKHFEPRAETRALVPSEIRLVSPLFNLDPAQYNARYANLQTILSTYVSHQPYSSPDIASVVATVDGTIYDDGAYAGEDHFQLLTRYQCVRTAERDEGAAVAQMMDSGAAMDDVLARLRQDAQVGLATNTSRRDPDAICAMYRGQEAQALLTQHRGGGEAALRRRASASAGIPKEEIVPLPKN